MTFSKVKGWAFSRLRLSSEDFYTMRPVDFFQALDCWAEDKKADRVHLAELVRGATVRIVNCQLSAKNQFKTVTDFWPMSHDEESPTIVGEELSEEDRKKIAKDFINKIGW